MPDQPEITVFGTPLRISYTAAEVLSFWPLVDEIKLYRLVMQGRLRAYLVNKDRRFPHGDTDVEYYGADEGAPHIVEMNGKRSLCWDYVRFCFLTVKLFERQWFEEVLGSHEELQEREKAESWFFYLLYHNKPELINNTHFELNHRYIASVNDDVHTPRDNYFTMFPPVTKEFKVHEEYDATYSVPIVELDEWDFQCRAHNLKTWEDVTVYEERHIDNKTTLNANIYVPYKLISGKIDRSIVKDMRENNYPEFAIAYILKNSYIEKLTKTKIGQLLYNNDRRQPHQKTYILLATVLLKQAEKVNIQLTR